MIKTKWPAMKFYKTINSSVKRFDVVLVKSSNVNSLTYIVNSFVIFFYNFEENK